jgi:hypothetical protein
VSRAQRVIAAIVAVITAVMLIESYGAMVDAAREGGRAIPALWPLGTEALALAMEVSVLEAKRLAQRAVLSLSWVLLVASVALSTLLQVAVAPPTLVGYVTAGATPVWLLGSFAVLSLLYRARLPASPTPAPAHARAQTPVAAGAASPPTGARPARAPSLPGLPARPAAPPAPPTAPTPARAAARPTRAGDAALLARARQLNASHLAAAGRPVSRDRLRAELGIGASRAERLLAQLTAAPPTGGPHGHPGRPGEGNGQLARLPASPVAARPPGPGDGQHA